MNQRDIETLDMEMQRTANRAMRQGMVHIPQRVAQASASYPGDALLVNGTFNDDNEFVQYELVGDIVGLKPVGP